MHYTFEEMYGNLMSNASYRLDPALTTITVERSGETIDWMGERLGMPFSDNVIVGYGPLQMMHLVDGAGPAMRTAMEDTLAGTGVELLLETEGTEILMNEDGSVKGVKAVRGADTPPASSPNRHGRRPVSARRAGVPARALHRWSR